MTRPALLATLAIGLLAPLPAAAAKKTEMPGIFVLTVTAPRPEVGTASYYGRYHAGKLTASGDRMNPGALTAAHGRLPLGAKVRVTNLDNGKSVVVTINDRCPNYNRRVIDLSESAAGQIGMIDAGLAHVAISPLRPAD